MPVVKATIKDIVKAPVGEGTVTYVSYDIRAAAEGGNVITAPGSWAQPIEDGVALTPSLDPGLYEVEISIGWFVEKYNIVVPDVETEQQLKTLIDDFLALPPDTPAVRLAAAIGSYFAENPVDGSGLDQTAVDARIETVGDTRYAPVSRAAKNPDEIAVGAITRSANGAATGFGVVWDDGATGVFVGTESSTTPGAIDSYTVTHVLGGVTTTYTQPALTRNANGAVTARPAMTVS